MKSIIRFAAALLLALLVSVQAFAQSNFPTPGGAIVDGKVDMCLNASGNAVPCSDPSALPSVTTQAPYGYTPLTPDQHNLAITAATTLTKPTGATYAVVCAKGQNVNYTTDGTTTPTASVGTALQQNQCVALSGATVIGNFKAIQQAATATLDVNYFK